MINLIGGNGIVQKDFVEIVELVFKFVGIFMDILCQYCNLIFLNIKISVMFMNLIIFLFFLVFERFKYMVDVVKLYDFINIDG